MGVLYDKFCNEVPARCRQPVIVPPEFSPEGALTEIIDYSRKILIKNLIIKYFFSTRTERRRIDQFDSMGECHLHYLFCSGHGNNDSGIPKIIN